MRSGSVGGWNGADISPWGSDSEKPDAWTSERIVVLQNVNKIERRERIRTAVLKKLDENTELKEAYRTLVKDLPAEQQEKAMASIATRTMRSITPRPQTQGTGAKV